MLDLMYQARDRVQGAGVVANRGWNSVPVKRRALIVERYRFDFGATEVDADSHFNH